MMKRLTFKEFTIFEDKNEEQLKTIKHLGEKQVKATKYQEEKQLRTFNRSDFKIISLLKLIKYEEAHLHEDRIRVFEELKIF